MSYNDPMEEDARVLSDFYERLSDELTDGDGFVTRDLIFIHMQRYKNPEDINKCPRTVDKSEFFSASDSERAEMVKQSAKEFLQSKMDDALTLSKEHEVRLERISGLN